MKPLSHRVEMDAEKEPGRVEVPETEDLGSYAVEATAIPGKLKKGRTKSKLSGRKAFSLEESQKSLSRQVPVRSLTVDEEKPLERSESLSSRSSFTKHNKTFHKLFPELPESEELLHAYVCALQKEVPYHGRLFISETHVCFYSSVLLKDTRVLIPTSSVSFLKKQNTALLVPNALSLRTADGEKHQFVSLRNRESCYKLLRSVCPQLEDGSTNSSPLFSSTENSFDHSSKLMNSSQSSLEDSCEVSPPVSEVSPSPRVSLSHESAVVKTSPSTATEDDGTNEEDAAGSWWVWSVTERARSLLIQREINNLNTLLLVYLVLVLMLLLSSGYIGLRIVALEEQLTTLGAMPDLGLHSSGGLCETGFGITLQKVTSIPMFIVGILGNIYVLVVFCHRPRVEWTYMKIYISNMAIADCALLIFLPVKIHFYNKELPGDLTQLCNIVLLVYYINMYVSIYTVTAISVVRFIAIMYPMKAREIFSCRNALVVCALIWVLICSVSPLYFVADSTNDKTMCFQRVKETLSLHFILLLVVIGFLLPFLIMLYCSARVVHTLYKQLNIGSRSEKMQCMLIILANLMVFVVCFLPIHLGYVLKYIVQKDYPNPPENYNCNTKQTAHNFLHSAFCFSDMNCGLDCIIYVVATQSSWSMCSAKQPNIEECDYNKVSDSERKT
ncbi:hypothetical protein DNTS_025786 [Danionella cerebrum]|uniref:G-protein coupled receptors family 1 profile domain-containing protein n=1 Tax=Danionella cerebrum TaxID=2873325 RepID=A0A553N4P6_9TELE|nr:hypothetical protein DNTS_025786 [Danionella translucida]